MISIHAPIQGATRANILGGLRPAISIHAPIQGATVSDENLLSIVRISIHAPIQGATSAGGAVFAFCNISIHAPIQGATYPPDNVRRRVVHFNSRAYTRRDKSCPLREALLKQISIHAPIQGATCSSYTAARLSKFQFTRLYKARQAGIGRTKT